MLSHAGISILQTGTLLKTIGDVPYYFYLNFVVGLERIKTIEFNLMLKSKEEGEYV